MIPTKVLLFGKHCQDNKKAFIQESNVRVHPYPFLRRDVNYHASAFL